MKCKLEEYTAQYLDRSWVWLNDPEIKHLTMTPDFTKEAQQAFFASLKNRTNYWIWGVALEGHGPIGAAGLKNAEGHSVEYWGYIGEKKWWGQGLGQKLMSAVIEEAAKLGFRSIRLKVRKDNSRAIALYKRQGFVLDHSASGDDYYAMGKVIS